MRATTFAAACILGASVSGAALAADLIVLTNQGATPGVKELATAFAKKSGHKVTVIQAEDAELKQRLNAGTADLITGKSRPDRCARLRTAKSWATRSRRLCSQASVFR